MRKENCVALKIRTENKKKLSSVSCTNANDDEFKDTLKTIACHTAGKLNPGKSFVYVKMAS